MSNNKKRVGSLFISLMLVLSLSLPTLAATKSPTATDIQIKESTINRLFPTLTKLSAGQDPVADNKTPEKAALLGDTGPAKGKTPYGTVIDHRLMEKRRFCNVTLRPNSLRT